MLDFITILEKTPNGVLATHDGAKLKTRVFQYLFAEGNKVYFCTNSEKPVYAQLQANSNISFCTYPADYAIVLSINGKAVFDEDMALKTRALDENPLIKGLYKTPENPVLKIFHMDVDEVETFSFTEGPKTYNI